MILMFALAEQKTAWRLFSEVLLCVFLKAWMDCSCVTAEMQSMQILQSCVHTLNVWWQKRSVDVSRWAQLGLLRSVFVSFHVALLFVWDACHASRQNDCHLWPAFFGLKSLWEQRSNPQMNSKAYFTKNKTTKIAKFNNVRTTIF